MAAAVLTSSYVPPVVLPVPLEEMKRGAPAVQPRPPAAGSITARRKLLSVARKATIEAADAEEDAEAALCAATTREERDAALEMLREASEMAAEADALMKNAESKMRRRQERASPPGFSPSPPLSDSSARSADSASGSASILCTENSSGRKTPHSGRLHSLTGSTPRRGISVPLQPIHVNSTYGSNMSLRSASGNTSARSANCNTSTGSNRSVGGIKVRPTHAGAHKDKANEHAQFEVQGRALGSHPEEPHVESAPEPAKCVARVPTPPAPSPTSRREAAVGSNDDDGVDSGCAWECSLCTKGNVGTAQACGVCGRKRGHLASARPTRRAVRHNAAVQLQSAYRGRAARVTVSNMRPSQPVDAAACKPVDLTDPRVTQEAANTEEWHDGEEVAAAGKFEADVPKDAENAKVTLECDDSVPDELKGASWSHPEAAADFQELNAIMERLQQQIPDSEDTPLPRESPQQVTPEEKSQTAESSYERNEKEQAPEQETDDLNVSIADATRMTAAFHKEAERLASAAKEAQVRAMNESVAWEDAHERSAAAFETARRLSIEVREEEERTAAEEAEARRLSLAAREDAVSRSRAEAAAARAAKKEAQLEKARKEAAAAAKREHELEERKKKMEAEKQQAAEAAETARKRANAAADREQALRKQQDERINKLRQDEVDNNKVAAEKQKLIAQLDRKLQFKLVGCSGPKRFMQVLRVFGVALDSNESAAVQKAYRKAMVLFHPDRAQRKGESWQKIVEAEEIYKLIQNEYQKVRITMAPYSAVT